MNRDGYGVNLVRVKLFSLIQSRRLLARIDKQRLRDIQRRHASSTNHYAKYADAARWLKRNLPRARRLGLDRSPPKQVLDLGCGAGFFLFLAKQLGHAGIGLDVAHHEVCNELLDLFGVERRVWRIQAFEPLPDFDRKFDLITAFSTAFNRSADESRGWRPEEWNFFLDDLFKRQLEPGGEIFFEINSGKDKRFFPAAVRDLFERRGAKIDGELVWWKPEPTA
ncbi:MAG TPA: class I SAM-dependent methyltransferase [Chthoniobacterales bacterium]|nr:class I SAM-dependent methyltransferase [Chthoniobacterales bacterium]